MGEMGVLRDLVVIFAVAVTVVTLLRRVGIPTIAGFIIAGMLIGPRSLGLISNVHNVDLLAEVGVVLLLFGIGLELSLDRLRRLWRPILLGGTLQVGISILVVFIVARALGLDNGTSVFLGFLTAVSSTAIVLRGLESRGELDAPHGRLTLGILVFQDLCVVPMMLLIPALAGSGSSGWSLAAALLRSAAFVAGVIIAARIVVPKVLQLVARTRQRELFVLTVFLICIGTAWVASLAGVSLALGAFMAGLVVAGSEFRHQAIADLIPFREVLSSVFFVSVGMLIVPRDVWENIGPILLILVGILLGKFMVVLACGSIMRLPMRVNILAAAALSQVGEFSFVLSRASDGTGLVEGRLMSNLVAASILSMLITPFALKFGPHLAAGVGRIRALTRLLEVKTADDAAEPGARWKDHVIIAGYGVTGQGLARLLRKCGTKYLVVDLNPDNVHQASENGEPAYYGDITSSEVLERLGAADAIDLVISINDPDAAGRAVAAARRVAPRLHIIVRARYLADVEPLTAAGADKVVPAEITAAVEITSYLLKKSCAYSVEEIEGFLSEIRGGLGSGS